ncbi:MAG: acetoin dehydrogenase subunit dihydrolipoyllysine-residue acetyltransferase [Acidobacteria bacterium]|nr:acetoin dehydrogenase subunit dihydrolipoyllysine-residue acetyltransferase [Acidobacteriota bacterium]
MPSLHSIRAVLAALALAAPLGASAQQLPAPPPLQEAGVTSFTIFLGGTPVGSEQIAVNRTATGWTITSSGRLGAPIDAVARRVQARYTADWRPLEFTFDGTVRGVTQAIHTVVAATTASSEITSGGQATPKVDTIDAGALLLLPSSFFGPYEALAARLKTAAAGTEIPAYLEAQSPVTIVVGESSPEQIQTAARLVNARRTRITLALPAVRLDADLWTDDTGRMIRFSVPLQSLEVVREDIAAVSSRSVTISRPNDQRINIPSNGFSLAGTVSKPVAAAAARLPAVVLVGGSGPTDRDGLAVGIPILGQIAGALADAGYLVIRYDKRGIGQSGGRAESASLADYADDVRAAIKLLSDRKDVDPKRIAVVGHSEGGLVALMTAAKDKRVAAVALIATPGMPGAEVVLAQQKRLLDRSKLTADEKQAKVDEQKKIHEAVITGKGLELLPPNVRRTVDNPEFQGILMSDPSKLVPQVRQPLLIVQGDLDTQVEPQNADQLEALARKRKGPAPVEVVKIPGINHLLVPATTGEFSEYADLKDKHVSAAVTGAIVTWLNKTLSPAR